VNVNLPERPKGIRWTRQCVRHYDGKVVPDKDPMGRSIFWFTVTPLEGPQRDRPLDLTDEADLARALSTFECAPDKDGQKAHCQQSFPREMQPALNAAASSDWELTRYLTAVFSRIGTVGEPINRGVPIPMEIASVADGGESIQLSAASDSGTVPHTGG
jgi:hypothetical protein